MVVTVESNKIVSGCPDIELTPEPEKIILSVPLTLGSVLPLQFVGTEKVLLVLPVHVRSAADEDGDKQTNAVITAIAEALRAIHRGWK